MPSDCAGCGGGDRYEWWPGCTKKNPVISMLKMIFFFRERLLEVVFVLTLFATVEQGRFRDPVAHVHGYFFSNFPSLPRMRSRKCEGWTGESLLYHFPL